MDAEGNPANQGEARAGRTGSEWRRELIRKVIFVVLSFLFAIRFLFRLNGHELLLVVSRVPHSVPDGVTPCQAAVFSLRV